MSRRPCQRKYERKEYARRKAAGLCTAHGCSSVAEPERVVCASHRQYQIQHNTAYRARHPEKIMLTECKRRAKERGVPFNLEITDIQIPEFCPVLGVRLARGCGVGGSVDSSPSLDCLIPSQGYVRGNVCVVSARANRIKTDASLDELVKVTSWMTERLR